jgi:SAM-dependent methyltransferase
MTSFSAKWLALREPYDQLARSTTVLDAVAAAFHDRRAISVVDLACGTGATLRAIASHLPALQAWRLVDNDLGLLAQAAVLARPPDRNVEARPVDLVRDLELALDGAIDLITTSALLAVEAAARRLPVYAALTYQGRATLAPAEPFDLEIVAAVNRHQRRDKGFGPALGPDAAHAAVARFEHVGYSVVHGVADWVFAPKDREIQLEMLSGWAAAAREIGGVAAADVIGWLTRRRELVTEGHSTIRVGHVDFFASPDGSR